MNNTPSFSSFEQLHSDAVSPEARSEHLHTWYQYLAREFRRPGWLFMNFGYADLDRPTAPAPLGDEGHPLASCARLYTRVAERLEPRGKRLLEVGCGRGGGAFTVLKRLKPTSLHAIDLSANAIDLCRESFPLPGLEFRVGSAEAIPFPDASFDGVLNVESSHCYPDFARFVAEVHRVLVPGGRFAIADMRPVGEFPAWRASLQAPGLRLLEERDITAEVLAALRLTNEFKRRFAAEHVPEEQRPHFLEFMGVEGSWYFETLRRGEQRYALFLLRK